MADVRTGEGWAAASLDDLGDGPGGVVRVDAATVRSLRNTSPDREATYFAVGGDGGYVDRDGRRPDDEPL